MNTTLISFLILLVLMVRAIETAVDSSDYQKPKPIRMMDLIKLRGFIGEMYNIPSKGYPLTIYRITNPLADQKRLNKYPVLYGHGVLYDAMSMISRSEHTKPRKPIPGVPTIEYGNPIDGSDDYSLPFMFSNNNFDVWLFDAKGTEDANINPSVKIDIEKANKFWDYSLDEQSLIDLPLLINFVLTKTASSKLVYVAFSESTFFMNALLSTEPKYAEKVAAFVAMAPVAYVTHIKGMTVPIFGLLSGLTPEFLHYSYFPQPIVESVDTIFRSLCQTQGIGKHICRPVFDSIAGKGSDEMGPEFFTKFFHMTSLKSIKHFVQLYLGHRFGMYDHGPFENLKRYGQIRPPSYDLSRVRSDRIILCRGLADFLSTPEDQARLIQELGVKPFMDIVIPQFNHFDFVDGKDLIKLANAPIMIGVYKLLYKDGPNILKNQSNVSNTGTAQAVTTSTGAAQAVKTSTGAAQAVKISIGKPQAVATSTGK